MEGKEKKFFVVNLIFALGTSFEKVRLEAERLQTSEIPATPIFFGAGMSIVGKKCSCICAIKIMDVNGKLGLKERLSNGLGERLSKVGAEIRCLETDIEADTGKLIGSLENLTELV